MTFVEVRNDSGKQLSFPAVRGLVFLPGEVKKVSPATVKHPAVSSYIGRGLTLLTSSQGEEPKAPIPTAKAESPKPAVPVAEPMPAPEPPVMDTPEKTAGNLQEAYLAAPGVSEENVQTILTAFPTFSDLANASPTQVQDATGLSKSGAKRLIAWAASQ